MKDGLRTLKYIGVLSLVAMMLSPLALRAQVAGMVRDSASQLPLPGTAVIVLDPAGRAVSRSVTDPQGRFRLATTASKGTGRAAPRTVYPLRLRVLRMGFRPREVTLTPASAGTYWDLSLVSFPIHLEEVQVVAVTCPKRPDRAQALSLLRQVRMSLLANVVARSQSSATMQRLLFERRYDGAGRIASQTVRKRVTSSTTEPFSAARSAAAFSRQGFVEDATGAHTYIGPDAETLIDDAFAERYCFKVAPPDRARPLQVGLGFEPVDREDGRIDIVGTVWVDTLSRVLRDLDFHYLGLDQQTSALSPEGRLSFRELSNGVVVIDQWSLRLGSQGRPAVRTLVGRTAQVTTMEGSTRERPQEIGGEIARASWPDGYSWEAPLGTIRLHAVDGQGRPVTGTVVQLLDTDYKATTDASGTFVLEDLLPGPYTASVRDPRLAALDVPSTTTLRLSAVRDSTIDARVVVESADDYVMKRCGYDAVLAGRARLLGRVTTADGRAASEARWTMRDEFGTVLVEGGRVDGEGFFHSCQLPMNRSVTIDVSQGDRRVNASRSMSDPLTTLKVVLP